MGDGKGQQLWEALVLLIALHQSNIWLGKRAALHIASDNIAARTLAAQLKAKGHAETARRNVAKQLALL